MAIHSRGPGAGGNQRHGDKGKSTYVNDSPLARALAALCRVNGRDAHQTGPMSHRTDCPNSHRTARDSLVITEMQDGAVMLWCHACNDTPAILRVLGLSASDLYPKRARALTTAEQRAAREAFRQAGWRAALRVLNREAMLVHIASFNVAYGITMAPADLARLDLACERIAAAAEVLV